MTSARSTRLSFSLLLEPGRLLRARQRIRDYLHSCEASVDDSEEVVLAIEEAMTNAVRHSGARKNLEVDLSFQEADLTAEVRDRGIGYDPGRFDPGVVPDPRALGGRGLYLISRLMDDMELGQTDGGGLTVRMRKRDLFNDSSGAPGEPPVRDEVVSQSRTSYVLSRERAFVEDIAEGFAALDWEYRFTYANDTSLALYAMQRDEVVGRVVWELFPHLSENPLGQALKEAMECGRPAILEYESPFLGRYLEYRVYPTRSGLSFYSRDIDERKRRELRVEQDLETTRLLLEAASELNRWTDVRVLLDMLAGITSRATGHSRSHVGILAGDRSHVTLISNRGPDALAADTVLPWEGLSAPIREALTTGRTTVADYDRLPPSERRIADALSARLALIVPLVFGGRVLGYIALDDPDGNRGFTEREVAVVEGIAAAAAGALENARHFEAERVRMLYLKTLAEIDELLTASLDSALVVERAQAAVGQYLGVSASTVWRLDRDGRTLSVVGVRGFPQRFMEDFARGVRLEDDRFPVARAARLALPEMMEQITADGAIGAPVRDAYARYGLTLGSLAVVPLSARGVVVGAMTLAWPNARRFPEEEISFLASLASRFANSLENARLFEEQHRIATILQESLLHPVPAVEGLEIVVKSLPANQPELVGGDFSDVFEMDEGRVAILIGDVAGKGIRAAAMTEAVRSKVRAFASIDNAPAFILRRTNELLLRHDPDEPHVTALLCVLDPRTGHLTLASAGHPAPIHVSPGRSAHVDVPFGPPLGSLDLDYGSAQVTLARGDHLVLYTDGVTETRREGVVLGEERLVEVVDRLRGRSAADLAQGVADAAVAYGGGLRDDLHIVVVRLAR